LNKIDNWLEHIFWTQEIFISYKKIN
jgi:hypothetical protein